MIGSTEYGIYNKDVLLCTFEWDTENYICNLKQAAGMPAFASSAQEWLDSRMPQKHREHIERVLKLIGQSTLKGVIDYTHGLSLTDTMWVKPNHLDLPWDAVSLYRHEFDEVIAHTAFDGGMYGRTLSTTSPEFTTGGMLPKCWVREGQDIVLVKGGTSGFSNTGNEPYSEVMASQILDRLEFEHVKYWLANYRGRKVSKCKLLTSEQVGMVPIYKVFDSNSFEKIIFSAKERGFGEGVAQHLVLDYLTCNTDRHLGNLSVLFDNDSFELLKFAPIYDNGCAMLTYWNGQDSIAEYTTQLPPSCYSDFGWGVKRAFELWDKKALREQVSQLIGFKFYRTQLGDFPDVRIDKLEEWLQTRVEAFFQL